MRLNRQSFKYCYDDSAILLKYYIVAKKNRVVIGDEDQYDEEIEVGSAEQK